MDEQRTMVAEPRRRPERPDWLSQAIEEAVSSYPGDLKAAAQEISAAKRRHPLWLAQRSDLLLDRESLADAHGEQFRRQKELRAAAQRGEADAILTLTAGQRRETPDRFGPVAVEVFRLTWLGHFRLGGKLMRDWDADHLAQVERHLTARIDTDTGHLALVRWAAGHRLRPGETLGDKTTEDLAARAALSCTGRLAPPSSDAAA